jgi:hypothetical protein
MLELHFKRRRFGLAPFAGVLIAIACVMGLVGAEGAKAQQDQDWAPGVSVTPPAKGDGWATENRPAPPAGEPEATSEAMEKAREALSSNGALPGVILSARLTEDGRVLDSDLTWRVYADPKNADEKPTLIAKREEYSPRIELSPGTYLINVSLGRSHMTRRIEIEAGAMKEETFILNAGGLRLAAYAGKHRLPDTSVRFDIFETESDQAGQRRMIIANARPGTIIRLNAGIYFLRSTYGGANAVVEAEVSVEAGKLTEISLEHAAAKVTLSLVTRPGGDALPATQWTIETLKGDVIDRSVGALPSHILAPGTYKVTASNGGRIFEREFTVEDNQTARVEVIAQ